MRRLIVFLVRIRLRLKLNQRFTFVGQKSNAEYYFTKTNVMKSIELGDREIIKQSGVSLNWLIDRNCKIEKVA